MSEVFEALAVRPLSLARDDGASPCATAMPVRRLLLTLAAALLLAACGEKTPQLPKLGEADVILAFGDSITYGTGAGADETYPKVLSTLIRREVIGAGVPGEVTADGLHRLPGVLDEHKPRLLLLCLGGNDMLKKVNALNTESNLRSMIRLARDRGIAVVLIGVPEPALFGGTAGYYAKLAQEFRIPLENEVLHAVLFDNGLKSDAIHPNARGYRRLAESVAELLRRAGAV
jgi:acyl-CoA thioesterase I